MRTHREALIHRHRAFEEAAPLDEQRVFSLEDYRNKQATARWRERLRAANAEPEPEPEPWQEPGPLIVFCVASLVAAAIGLVCYLIWTL